MATNPIPAAPSCANTATASAYWDGTLVCEDIALDAERIAETAYNLACSTSIDSSTQSAFYALGQLADRLKEKVKKEEARLEGLSNANREAAQ